jgi:probable lipoprotein (TIGR04455 family)
MQNIIFVAVLVLLFTQCSSIQYVKKSPTLAKEIASTKRILILPSKDNQISKEENAMLHDVLRQEISHHSLFIVYKAPAKFKNTCSKEFPKIEGIFTAEMKEIPMGNKSQFALKGILQKCSTGTIIWEAKAIDKFALEANENMSLIKTYSEKYGDKVSTKVNAYR